MGVQKSKLSKHEREHREQVKNNFVKSHAHEIKSYQKNIFHSVQKNEIKEEDAIQLLNTSSKIKQQVERGNQALTKTDLIAIIIALDRSFGGQLTALEKSSVGDLNVIIRGIIYQADKYITMDTSSSSNDNHNNNLFLLK